MNWLIEYNNGAPDYIKSDKVKKEVEFVTNGVVNYVFTKLQNQADKLTLENVNGILFELLDEMPVMRPSLNDGEFIIKYNRYITIKLNDPIKSIYREIKLNKLLNG